MSFDYNPMGAMVPIMGNMSNLTNGTNFIPHLATTGAVGALSGTSVLPTHISAGLNDSPLEFKNANNSSKNSEKNSKSSSNQMGAGPMDLENENDSPISVETMKRAGRESRFSTSGDDSSAVDSSEMSKQNSSKNMLMGSEMFLNGMMGMPQGFMMVPGMVMDPTAMATLQMQQFSLLPQLTQSSTSTSSNVTADGTGQQQSMVVKELITCNSCVLYPPNPNAPAPTTRDRPPGCRTVFVGGLPENITKEIIRDIFERCGEITTLRVSKKNFCHIRFTFETSVDSAIYLSGYRIRISNSTEAQNCGRLHVDYAQARDDQYEWECKQRQLQREQRHRERLERDRLRPSSPPPVVHYTEHEASNISEKLKNDETFCKAVQTLIVWLERGDCSKKNSNSFYSMIQSTNAHVRRLQNDKMQYEEELRKAREQYRKRMISMNQQFTQIEKVFSAAIHKKVWDHFTKAQRKNIDVWKKQATEIRCVQVDLTSHDEDEMEMSDEDKDYRVCSMKRTRYDNDNLKEENDNLRCQLEAYKNEVNLVKSDLKSDTDVKDQQIKVLQETIRNLQTHLIQNKMKEKDFSTKISDLEAKLKQANVKELLLKTKIVEAKNSKNAEEDNDKSHAEPPEETGQKQSSPEALTIVSSSSPHHIKTEKIGHDEARIIGLVSTFLVVHPFGASADYICSYLQRIQPDLRPRELEEILGNYKSIFCEEVTGIGAKIERKWKFCGFEELDCRD